MPLPRRSYSCSSNPLYAFRMDFVGFRSAEGGSGWRGCCSRADLPSREILGGSLYSAKSEKPTFLRAMADEEEDSASADDSGVIFEVEAGAEDRLDSP